MADPRSDPSRPIPRPSGQPGSTNGPRPTRSTDTGTQRPEPRAAQDHLLAQQAQDSLLDGTAEPTDESPTVISKAQPRLQATSPPLSGDLRGRHLAHFELIEHIGVGGMAAVLRAHDTQLDRDVALKILPPDMAVDQENVSRFHQEARSAAKLDHENIARVFFCGEDQGLHFIAFEFVEGDNLRTVLERRGRLPVDEALSYVTQVAAGLAHAAERGVVHRDIKPSNILITPDRRAKLVDMGLARSLERQDDKGLTHSGVTLGTFDYISPEQALEPREADVRSDIYSLGCTLYHLLTGRPPVPEGTAARKLHHHQHIPPIDPRELVPDLPDEVAVLLNHMMAKRPELRQQTAGELLGDLVRVDRALSLAAGSAAGLTIPTPMSWTLPVALAGLAVVAVIALVVVLAPTATNPLSGSEPSPRRPVDVSVRPDIGTTLPAHDNRQDTPPTPIVADVPAAVFEDENPTEEGLADWLQKHADAQKIVIRLARDLDLVVGSKAGQLLINAQEIDFGPKPGSGAQPHRPTIRLTYAGDAPPKNLWAALTFEGKKITIHGLRFVLNGGRGVVPLAALWLKGEEQTVQNCEFYQAQLSQDERNRVASIVVQGSSPRSLLTLEQSCFLGFGDLKDSRELGLPVLTLSDVEAGGQDALVVIGSAGVTVKQCAFGPHDALCRVDGNGKVTLSHCTFLAGPRPAAVFHVLDSGADLEADHCLFSGPRRLTSRSDDQTLGSVVIRQERSGSPSYRGKDIRYCNLSAFETTRSGMSDYRQIKAQAPDAQDNGSSRWLRSNPMLRGQPLHRLAVLSFPDLTDGLGRTTRDAVFEAFQPDDRAYDMRVDRDHLIGVEMFTAGSYLKNRDGDSRLPPLEAEKRQTLIVDPTRAQDDSINGYFQTLGKAIANAKPGDRILLRSDEVISMLSIPIEIEGTLTLAPDEDYHPILVQQPPDNRKNYPLDSALFRLTSGALQFEHLEFQVKPLLPELKSQAVVAMVGDGPCNFIDCLITLEAGEASPNAVLAAVTLTDSQTVMRKPGGQPELRFSRCVVRGQGDLVLGQVARPLKFVASNSLFALSGSLLSLEMGLTAVSEPKVDVSLSHVTACVGSNLLNLRALPRMTQVLQVVCSTEQCLFLPLTTPGVLTHVLVHIEGPDLDADKLDKQFVWKQAGGNAYGTFDPLLETRQGDGQPVPTTLAFWQAFVGEKPDAGDKPENGPSRYRVPLDSKALTEEPREPLVSLKLRPMAMRVSEFGLPESERQALVELFPQLLPRTAEPVDKE